jgi:NTP pyrophosphatase (non-canonical NTP hydrolase)
MTLSEYQVLVKQFLLPESNNREYLVYGLGAEAGEVQDVFAKAIRDNQGVVPQESLRKELGDVLFFVAMVGHKYGMSLDDIAISNINKLRSRKDRGVIHGSGDNR